MGGECCIFFRPHPLGPYFDKLSTSPLLNERRKLRVRNVSSNSPFSLRRRGVRGMRSD